MTTCHKVEWLPPDGSGALAFESGGLYHLARFNGSFSTKTAPVLRKAAGQVGSTLIDRSLSERTTSLQCYVRAADPEAFQLAKQELIRVLSGVPGESDVPARFGTLRVYRPGLPPVETLAEPVDSPQEARRHNTRSSTFDIEWLCPSPLWRTLTDETVTLSPAPEDPWVSPWVSPWFSPAAQASAEVVNTGHVPVGVVARFHGPQNTVRLVNATTGEQLQVFGAISAGEVLEVDTEARTARLNGVMVLDRWDWHGHWWRLRRGAQTVIAEANTASPDARTVVIFRPAFAGV